VRWVLFARYYISAITKRAVHEHDALIARVPSQSGWIASKYARKMNKPYMIETIGDPYEAIISIGNSIFHKIVALLFAQRLRKMAKYATAGSFVNSSILPKTYPLSKDAPWNTISSINLPSSQVSKPRKYPSALDKVKIIMVASMYSYKRHQDLLYACRKLLDQGIKTELHFAGDGPCRPSIEALCYKLGIRENTHFHGHVAKREALQKLLEQSDLFVLTSQTEGMPRAMIEGMSRGLPALGSNVGGIKELLDEDCLFPVGNVVYLTNLLSNLVNNPSRLSSMSKRSIEVAKQYTIDKLSDKRLQLYNYLRNKALAA
jgi:glycosyltransferase involved in cell wall biosynthesis